MQTRFSVCHKTRLVLSVRCRKFASVTMSSSVNKPTLRYFPGFRGRTEPIKLLLNYKNVEYDLVDIGKEEMKSDRTLFPFAQAPSYQDVDILISQSNTIVRYLGNKYNMFGKNAVEKARMDMFMEGVEALRQRYLGLVYMDRLSDEGKTKYFETHINPDTQGGRNFGSHFFYLNRLLLQNNDGKGGFVVGDSLSIADLQLFDIVDLHVRIFGDIIGEKYPALIRHFELVAAVPEIKTYLEGPLRLQQANNYGLG
eukprot:TRINITY_DN3613_c0_g2_i1.p1 TRINITY_DN3613_c0_g2~~TRINITY_DN3613_c0_g2_i1.p1  ORF type:complete len:295 (-),score=42.28 TRINITY_DN3613_c0_g2_i1:198-959(-)